MWLAHHNPRQTMSYFSQRSRLPHEGLKHLWKQLARMSAIKAIAREFEMKEKAAVREVGIKCAYIAALVARERQTKREKAHEIALTAAGAAHLRNFRRAVVAQQVLEDAAHAARLQLHRLELVAPPVARPSVFALIAAVLAAFDPG
jgi:hypothetical protein